MFILKLIRYLRGYVRFQAQGVFVERFLNLVARDRIPVWDGRKRGDVYTGYVAAGSYRKMRKHAKKTGVRIRVADKEGAPFQRRTYSKRTGLLLGLGIFAAFLVFMSGFIWRIEISGNETLAESEILSALEDLGVAPGKLRSSINVRESESLALLSLKDLSWIALNIEGSVVHVEVTESATPPDNFVDANAPCSIVANRSGQITLLRVYDGQALVQKGDPVLEGDVLVSGITEDRQGQNLFKHALADITAIVQETQRVEVPLTQTKFQERNKTVTRTYLNLIAFELPVFLPFRITPPYRVEREQAAFTIFSMELPFGYLREEYILMEEVEVRLTEEEAKAQALLELSLVEQVEYGEGEIIERTLKGGIVEDAFVLIGDYLAEVPIGVDREILQQTGEEG